MCVTQKLIMQILGGAGLAGRVDDYQRQLSWQCDVVVGLRYCRRGLDLARPSLETVLKMLCRRAPLRESPVLHRSTSRRTRVETIP